MPLNNTREIILTNKVLDASRLPFNFFFFPGFLEIVDSLDAI